MAAPVYSEDLTDINLAEAITNWAESTDADWDDGGGPVADADYPFIQGSFSISQACTKATIASLLVNAGGGLSLPADGAYFVWHIFTAPTGLDSYANGGMRLMVGSGLGAFYSWDVGGKDFGRNPYGGWANEVVNPAIGSPDDTVGAPTGTEQYIGAAVRNLTAIGKGNPHAVDAVRYGRGSSIFESGDSGTPATFAGFAAANDAAATRWGLIQAIDGGYLYKGKMTFGTATAVYFNDANVAILIDNTPKVTANFNTIEVNHASSTVIWTNVRFQALGATSPGRLVMNANATLTWNLCQFDNMGAFTFGGTLSVCTNAAWRGCGQITVAGANISGSSVSGYEGAVDSAAIVWNVATDPDTKTDGMTVTKGTAATHAFEFGTSTPSTITLRNIDFSGYNAANGQTDSALLVDSTGTTTINLIGCTGNISYKSPGTVTLVIDPVTLTVTTKDASGTLVSDVRVLVEVSSGVNGWPYNASVTISRSVTTATVSHTAHGLATNDYVTITGVTDPVHLNGVRQITKTGVDSYTYVCEDAGTSGAASGTITATLAVISGTTTAGVITGSRTYATADQPFVGYARKASSPPYYAPAQFTGDINKTQGLSVTVQMGSDA